MRRVLLAGALVLVAATPALGELAPEAPHVGTPTITPVAQYVDTTAADLAAGAAAGAQAAAVWNAWVAEHYPPGVYPISTLGLLADVPIPDDPHSVPGGVNARENVAGPPAAPGGNVYTLRIKFNRPSVARQGLSVNGNVRMVPITGNIEAYEALVRLWRIGFDGITRNVGIPDIVSSNPARLTVGKVGDVCYPPRRHAARAYYISVTAAVLTTSGAHYSGTVYSPSAQVNC